MPLKLFLMELSKFHNFLTKSFERDTRAVAFRLLNIQESKVWISVFTVGSVSPA